MKPRFMSAAGPTSALLAALVALTGCAIAPTDPADQADASAPLYCVGPDECNLYWRRAQVWVAQNSPMKIQLVNDTLLETFNPPAHSMDRAYRVIREPQAGREEIKVSTYCQNIYGCNRSTIGVIASFKRYVKAAN